MASVTLKGTPIHTIGELPKVGSIAPDFVLVDAELKDRSLKDFKGKKKVLSIVPSLDTGTCAMSAKRFNEAAKQDPNLLVLVVSADLPFAQKRMCGAENIQNIQTLSMMRSKEFATKYGVLITDGPLAGIAARAIVVLDEEDKVLYTQLVPEIAEEPDYQKVLEVLKRNS